MHWSALDRVRVGARVRVRVRVGVRVRVRVTLGACVALRLPWTGLVGRGEG